MTEKNGSPFSPQVMPARQMQLDAQMKLLVGVNFRGILISSPDFKADELVLSFARIAGEIAATALIGDLIPTMNMRRRIVDEFSDAVRRMPYAQPVTGQAPSIEKVSQPN